MYFCFKKNFKWYRIREELVRLKYSKMDIKEKFEKEFGSTFIIDNKEDYPPYYISCGASRVCGLIDIEKANFNINWNSFKPRMSLLDEKYGVICYDKDNAYQFYFVKKAVEILNPNEYGLLKRHSKEKDDDAFILLLKSNKYVIAIAPIVTLEEEEYPFYWKVVAWDDFIMKTAKSVFVL